MFWSIKYIQNRVYKMYLQNENIAKLWVLSIFLTKEGLNKYIKLLCEMKLWDKLRRCSVKKVFLEISQILPENICVGVSFLISCRPQTWNSDKKRLKHRCFQVNFAELFKNTFFTEPLWRPLLYERFIFVDSFSTFWFN